MQTLGGKTCVVTGGASGIGLAMATRLQAAGMHVVIGDIESKTLAAATSELGPDVLGVTCDVTSPESMDQLRNAALDRFGAVHVVCLNAGVATSGPLLDTPLSSWRWLIEVNVLGIVNGIHAFGPALVAQGEGHIVCTASASGLINAPALGAYGATKHAVVGLAGVLRDELAASGVGVSVVCPGVVRTRIFESERNRPDSMAGPTHLDEEQARLYTDLTDKANSPEIVANAVHDAILANQLFVLPSPEVDRMIEARIDEVHAAMQR